MMPAVPAKEELTYDLVNSEELVFSDFNAYTGAYLGLEEASLVIPQDLGSISPLFSDDATTDIADLFTPVSRFGPPETGAFHGEYNFEIQVNAGHTHRNKYMFSHKLSRIYVDMGVNFSVQFSWDFARSPRPLYVRATTVFSNDSQAEKRVERCLQHKHAAGNPEQGPLVVHHVLRSTRELGTAGVYYCGDSQRPDSWYSVLVQFPSAPDDGSQAHTHAYQFACKNSCSTGINRRCIAIVFTLEDDRGKILGRQTVGARVCACPRRDMHKDEKESDETAGRKRVKTEANDQDPPQPGKKVKIDIDEKVYTIPAGMQIVGATTVVTGMNVMLKMMEQSASYRRNDAKAQEKFAKSIADVKKFLDQFKSQ